MCPLYCPRPLPSYEQSRRQRLKYSHWSAACVAWSACRRGASCACSAKGGHTGTVPRRGHGSITGFSLRLDLRRLVAFFFLALWRCLLFFLFFFRPLLWPPHLPTRWQQSTATQTRGQRWSHMSDLASCTHVRCIIHGREATAKACYILCDCKLRALVMYHPTKVCRDGPGKGQLPSDGDGVCRTRCSRTALTSCCWARCCCCLRLPTTSSLLLQMTLVCQHPTAVCGRGAARGAALSAAWDTDTGHARHWPRRLAAPVPTQAQHPL